MNRYCKFIAIISFLSASLCLQLGCKATPKRSDVKDIGANADQRFNTFDVNDVSYLFPFKGGVLSPGISATDTFSDGSEVYPADVFDSVTKFVQTQKITGQGTFTNRSDWKVMSFRFDPCAPSSLPAVVAKFGCQVQLRFIAQPVISGTDEDFTAHLVFTLGVLNPEKSNYVGHVEGSGTPSFKELVLDLQDLKKQSPVNTTGLALNVHPGLAADADGSYAAKVKAFLFKHMSSKKLAAVAFMGLQGGGPEPWIFIAGGMVPTKDGAPVLDPTQVATANGRGWFPVDAPVTPAGTKALTLSFLDRQRVIPLPTGFTSTQPLFDFNLSDPAVLGKVYDIDQPEMTHFFNMDCVSCHSSTTRMTNRGISAATNPNRYIAPAGITGYLATNVVPSNQWNVRNFGYFGGSATVSSRALTETASVVDFTNKELLKGENPGLVCGDRAVADKIWDCIVISGTPETQCFANAGCKIADRTAPTVPPPAPVVPDSDTTTPVVTNPVIPVDNPNKPEDVGCDLAKRTNQAGAKIEKQGQFATISLSSLDAKCFTLNLERKFNGSMFFGKSGNAVNKATVDIQCSDGNECRISGLPVGSEIALSPSGSKSRAAIVNAFRDTLQASGEFVFETSDSGQNGSKPSFKLFCNKSTCKVTTNIK
ncbi:MAG: hypothetical protein NT027_10420 [Proteobacteria bacterium]|nr:hypothetical protein [Pseudomonadota bacterium]